MIIQYTLIVKWRKISGQKSHHEPYSWYNHNIIISHRQRFKAFCFVLIFLDHGHIWKIRPGLSRETIETKRMIEIIEIEIDPEIGEEVKKVISNFMSKEVKSFLLF